MHQIISVDMFIFTSISVSSGDTPPLVKFDSTGSEGALFPDRVIIGSSNQQMLVCRAA